MLPPAFRLHSILIAAFFVLTACGGGGGDDSTGGNTNKAPTASITTPASGMVYAEGSAVMLQGSATDTEDGTLNGNSLSWSSNRDGDLGTGETVTAMLSVGDHVITLTATDSQGVRGMAQVNVHVNGQPTLGTLTVNPGSVNTGTAMTFSWMASDPEGDTLTCQLDVDDDGTADYTITDCGNNLSQVHTYAAAGNYTARLSLSDGINAPRETTVTATVTAPMPVNRAPVVNSFSVDQNTVLTGTTVQFNWSLSDADGDSLNCMLDVDGDGAPEYTISDCANNTLQAHTYTVAGNMTASLTVTDGSNTVTAPALTITVNGNSSPVITSFTDCANNTTRDHVFSIAGNYSATLRVTDSVNAPVSQVFNVVVSNPPIIQAFGASPAPYYAEIRMAIR